MKTTKRQFALYKKECLRLQPILGLMDWRIQFSHEQLNESVLAEISPNVLARNAILRLTIEIPQALPWTDQDIVRSAKHEMVHLLTARLNYIGGCRWRDESELCEADEGIARVLEKIL